MERMDRAQEIRVVAQELAEHARSDVLILNGPITDPISNMLIDLCVNRPRKLPNVLFLLVTEGGSAEAAYWIARCLQEKYANVTCFVNGYCKSAGTLLITGAHELVVGDRGELGPLDVQFLKEDELGETRSGLTVLSALNTLRGQAFDALEYFFLETKRRGGTISTRTAFQVATELASKLYAPIYEHIDAMHVGEAGRFLDIAVKYGELLNANAGNLHEDALDRLRNDYPSHSFVIDRMQAETLFRNVRKPDEGECRLAELLGPVAVRPYPIATKPMLAFLNGDTDAHEEAAAGVNEHGADELDDNKKTHTAASAAERASSERHEDAGVDSQRTEPDAHRGLREVGS